MTAIAAAERECSIVGCAQVMHARGMCRAHYLRLWKMGEHETLPRFVRPTPIERLLSRVTQTPGSLDTECWLTSYRPASGGYVQIRIDGRNVPAHRLSYEHHVGPVPEGLFLDHLCRNRACVNPDHLEPVTNRENFLRGVSPGALAVRTNLCMHGHSLADAYPRRRRGGRLCRTCQVIRNERRRA